MTELLHFSEDPDIGRFEPHVAATASEPTPYVWAVDLDRAPAYWFPRDCPRVAVWAESTTTSADRDAILGPAGRRVHAIESRWLPRMLSTQLFVYRFASAEFRPYEDYAFVADHAVHPIGRAEPVGDLVALHERAGIELTAMDDLGPWWSLVSRSTCGFSGIRLANARGAEQHRPHERAVSWGDLARGLTDRGVSALPRLPP